MPVSENFKSFVADQFEPLGGIEIRRMFGAAGVTTAGRVFALLDDDVLYFKVDAGTMAGFDAEAMEPFSYPSKNGTMTMQGYRRCPDRLYDEPDEFIAWAKAAMAVAERGPAPAKKRVAKAAASNTKTPRAPAAEARSKPA